eukprot:PhM_4_TR11799/c0_g1_i1/m.44908
MFSQNGNRYLMSMSSQVHSIRLPDRQLAGRGRGHHHFNPHPQAPIRTFQQPEPEEDSASVCTHSESFDDDYADHHHEISRFPTPSVDTVLNATPEELDFVARKCLDQHREIELLKLELEQMKHRKTQSTDDDTTKGSNTTRSMQGMIHALTADVNGLLQEVSELRVAEQDAMRRIHELELENEVLSFATSKSATTLETVDITTLLDLPPPFAEDNTSDLDFAVTQLSYSVQLREALEQIQEQRKTNLQMQDRIKELEGQQHDLIIQAHTLLTETLTHSHEVLLESHEKNS